MAADAGALAKATQDLVEAENNLVESRTAESREIRRLKKRTDEVKDSQKQFENSLRETVRSMSFADLGKQLKNDLLSPFESFLNNLPAPIKTLGMIGMKAAQGVGRGIKKATDPGVRFDAEGTKRWRKMHDDGKLGQMVSGAEAAAMGATKEEHTAGNEQIGLLSSIKTGIFKLVAGFFALLNWFKKKFAKPDPSKLTEKAIEGSGGEGGGGAGGDDDGGGIFGGIKKTIAKIKGFIKKFITWKGMVVLLITSIIGGLAIKYWEPIKEIVLSIKDKIMGIYNTIKEWFMSIWDWGVATGTDEDGEWSVTTFVTNIWDKIKKWFEDKWIWISKGIAAGWTNVTDFISGVWGKVKKWFSDLWAWGKDAGQEDPSGGWKLSTFIKSIFTGLKDWFFGLFGLQKDQEELDWETGEMKTIKGNWSFSGLIEKIFTGLKNWFFGLFGLKKDQEELDWETGEMKTIKGDWSFSGLISKIFTGMKSWFFGLFGIDAEKGELSSEDFAEISKGFSLTDLLMKTVKSIGDYFWNEDGTGLLNFDLPDIKGKIMNIGKLLSALGTAGWEAGKVAINPFSEESATEVFKRIFKQEMSKGSSVSNESDPFASTYASADFSLPLAGDAQIIAEPPTTAQMANTLYSAGPRGSGGGGTSVVDASTSNMATSTSSNTNFHITQRAPAKAFDPHTTAQYRRFRGMRGGGG